MRLPTGAEEVLNDNDHIAFISKPSLTLLLFSQPRPPTINFPLPLGSNGSDGVSMRFREATRPRLFVRVAGM